MEEVSECSEVVLQCHLHCQSEGTTEVKPLSLPSLPPTVLELKEVIQQEFSVPTCIQKVAFQTEVLSDDTQLASRRLRSGDSVDVTFLARGDCRLVEEVNAWMRNLVRAYEERELGKSTNEVDHLVYDGLQSGLDSTLGYDLFEWLIPRTMVNKAYFESSGGLALLPQLYQQILRSQWSDLPIYQRYLESVCTQAFANFGETAALRRKLIKMGILELCFKTMLRVKVPQNGPIADTASTDGDQEMNDTILKTELDNALHLLCCFSELPECQLPIACRSSVLVQTVNMALSPSYSCPTTALTAEVLLCLAHTPATHPYLASEYVISGMLQALVDRPGMVDTSTPSGLLQLVGLRCFTLLWLSIIILQSPRTLAPATHTAYLCTIKDHMTAFLNDTQTDEVRQYENERGTIWATLLPYVKQAYLPDSPTTTLEPRSALTDLQVLSLEIILFFLHSKATVPMYHALLLKEDLLDFVVCLPWHVPAACRPQAAALTSELCASMPGMGPPRLSSIAKARLAKLHFGLERVLSVSVGEIASCYYNM